MEGGGESLPPHFAMQMDFIGSIYDNSVTQLGLFDIIKKEPSRKSAELFFHSITEKEVNEHQEYWAKREAGEPEQEFQRYLFAFLSVHTTWENNVKAYTKLKDFWEWMGNKDELRQRLEDSGVGLHNRRVEYISGFSSDFWKNRKSEYTRKTSEPWTMFRDRLEYRIKGLGLAKTSFALELQKPLQAHCFCADTHLFQLYKLSQNSDRQKYKDIESHWLDWAKMFSIPSYIARAIYWNRKQKQNNCDYWAYCL